MNHLCSSSIVAEILIGVCVERRVIGGGGGIKL
jgi:hypothetical protein